MSKRTITLKQDTNIMMHPGIISNILPKQIRVMSNISKVSFKSGLGLSHSSSGSVSIFCISDKIGIRFYSLIIRYVST